MTGGLICLYSSKISSNHVSFACRTQVMPAARVLVCSLIFIEYESIKKLMICFKVWILQTLHTSINHCTKNQYLSNQNEPEHHDDYDNRTEKTDVY